MGVDSQERIEQGELLTFDADEVLNRLMVSNRPNAECFEDTINGRRRAISARVTASRERDRRRDHQRDYSRSTLAYP